ncbi:MAG: hypothetical protein K2M60_00180 [Lachnospiraceae bacterium]|nr:hypothetical protein [Lachnospiraceae bacterium]MDE6251032.1 hypothetical protein [Lachnospiraceae bacterium]
MNNKRLIIITVCAAAVMSASACGKNPDSSIVKNKDFDKMIEKAQDSKGDNKEVKDIAPEYDTYQNLFSDESLKVTVKADAKVDIPNVDKMSIIRMKQKNISQDFLSRVIDKLAGDEQLYDGSITEVRTRKEIEEEIHSVKQSMKNSDDEESEEGWQKILEELQEEYENSTADIDWDKYVSDKQLHSVEEMSENMNNSFYKWQKDLNPDGEVFYAVNKGENGQFISVYAQNNKNYGNCLRFGKSRHGHIWNMPVVVGLEYVPVEDEKPREDSFIWRAGSDIPTGTKRVLGDNPSEYTDECVTITEEEAKKKADEFLKDIDIDDFKLYNSGLYNEMQMFRKEVENVGYATYYLFRYVREVDGTLVTLEGNDKYSEGWNNDSYVKKFWPKECIEFKINDNGIIEFKYNGPMEKVETVVEKSNMKPFDAVKDTFEKMVIAANAQYELDGINVNIDIDRVVLGYAMISEKDRFDTGLLVPVWDFIGTKELTPGDGTVMTKDYESVMTINAIDGTVIDRTLGY